ncbi:MAG: hypothetical protein HYZ52_01570 [Candidatus Omnitrophica bacterium]|nr:hypothetical protein [Candidatus Omnitrophota bacterium]
MTRIPLHPFLVHFPIAFFFLELVCLVFWARKKDAAYERFARFAFTAGFLFLIAAMAVGWIDAGGFGAMGGSARRHFYGACSVFIFYALRAVHLKTRRAVDGQGPKVFRIAGAAMGNLLIFLTAYWGGILVYA